MLSLHFFFDLVITGMAGTFNTCSVLLLTNYTHAYETKKLSPIIEKTALKKKTYTTSNFVELVDNNAMRDG